MIAIKTVAVAVSLVVAASAVAGAETPLAVGSQPTVRVRLRNDDVVQGFLRGNSADELVVFTSERRYRHLSLADVQRFEVRQRTGTQAKRGAVMGVFLWASLMFAASIHRLEDAGAASWESAAVLAGSAGLGAAIGKGVPRYGWVPTEPSRLAGPSPVVRLTLRF